MQGAISFCRLCWLLVLPIACFGFIGCGGGNTQELPKTYEAKGKVELPNGQPMTGGLIEFRPTDGSEGMTTGQIQPDGTFALTTMIDGEKLPGAKAGSYLVTIMPPMGTVEDQQHGAAPIGLPKPFDVKAEGTNDFPIRLKK